MNPEAPHGERQLGPGLGCSTYWNTSSLPSREPVMCWAVSQSQPSE
ncbi:hypothetical protein BH11MYX4_BH11MYX4_62680 [soil metagenome]